MSESKDLAAQHPDIVKDLHARLAAWRKDVGALMPTANTSHFSALPESAPLTIWDGSGPED